MWEKEKEAFKQGKRIQIQSSYGLWNTFTNGVRPCWIEGGKYRIHPDDVEPEKEDKYIVWNATRGTISGQSADFGKALSLARGYACTHFGDEVYVMKAVSVSCAKQGPVVVNTEILDKSYAVD